MTKLHLLGLPHTVVSNDYSHCAFTGKILRFSKMMQNEGWEVIEYSNEGSESEAKKKIVILTEDQRKELYKLHKTEFPNDVLNVESSIVRTFNARLISEMTHTIEPYDIVCHPFGPTHSEIVRAFPNVFHVETGIGYDNPYLDYRIYESYSHWHYVMGKQGIKQGNDYNWVIPNYYDPMEWEPSYEEGKYLLFFGRIQEDKGLNIVKEIAKHTNKKIICCGALNLADHLQGETSIDNIKYPMFPEIPNLIYKKPVKGKERSDLLRKAYALLCPTRYIEPFGGVAIEAMLCGTPVITSEFGAFSETVDNGFIGYRCQTLHDWLRAIKEIPQLQERRYIARMAEQNYSLGRCGMMYTTVFNQILDLKHKGWYTL